MILPVQIVGLDISLARTGWASVRIMPDGFKLDYGTFPTLAVPPGDPNYYPLTLARVRRIIENIAHEIPNHHSAGVPLYVAIEAASFGTKAEHAAQADARAGLRWLVYDRIEPVAEVVALIPPRSLKLYVTGKGGARKPDMVKAIRAAFPDYWITNDDNEADAIGLACMLARQMGCPLDAEQSWHHAALNGMKWPSAISGTRGASAYQLDGLDSLS